MQIVFFEENLQEMSCLILQEKYEKYYLPLVC